MYIYCCCYICATYRLLYYVVLLYRTMEKIKSTSTLFAISQPMHEGSHGTAPKHIKSQG